MKHQVMRTGHGILLAACLLTACATTPTPPAARIALPSERLLLKTSPLPDETTVVVTRDKGVVDSACYLQLQINGEPAGRFGPRETATFHLAAGLTQFRVGNDPQGHGLCAARTNAWTQRGFALQPGQVEHFRLSLSGNAVADIQRTD